MISQSCQSFFSKTAVMVVGVVAAMPTASQAQDQKVPYDLGKFRPVLDASKLQAPTSSPTMINRGKFEGASNEYFFLDPTGQYMTFTVSGDSKRAELRQLSGEWDTASSMPQRVTARLRVFKPETPELEQFTFLQIHDTTNDPGSLNKPLIRITRRGDYRKTQDHLWAAIRTPKDFDQPISLDNLATLNIDLGPRPEGFFDAEIRVHNSQLLVTIDGKTVVDLDVSYWDGLQNYFKAGVYNQDPGTSVVQFEALRFIAGDDPAEGSVEVEDVREPE